jgi:hypothetical protein
MNHCAVADTCPLPVHDDYPGMHSQANFTRLDAHREKLTLQQAPSTYTDVQTKTISVPITEVCPHCKHQKLASYMTAPSHQWTSTNRLASRFPLTTRRPAQSPNSQPCQAPRLSCTRQSCPHSPALSFQCNLVAQSTKHPSPPKKGRHSRRRCTAFKL